VTGRRVLTSVTDDDLADDVDARRRERSLECTRAALNGDPMIVRIVVAVVFA